MLSSSNTSLIQKIAPDREQLQRMTKKLSKSFRKKKILFVPKMVPSFLKKKSFRMNTPKMVPDHLPSPIGFDRKRKFSVWIFEHFVLPF